MSLMRRLLWGLPVVGALAAGGLFLTQKGRVGPGDGERRAGERRRSRPT